MPDIETVRGWRGKAVVDRDGDRIGTIADIYADDQTGRPDWALIDSGFLGRKSTFVPLAQANLVGDDIEVPYSKQLVDDAPGIEADEHLSAEEEQRLWQHYGLDYGVGETGQLADADTTAAAGRPSSDDAMTRSEEELRVGTRARERGRVRLRKYVTTEQVQQTVPVQREEVRVEREPITDANIDAATSGPEISEAEHEVTLHEEEPVVEKQVVPKEWVRLDTETVTDEREVAEEVRKEQVDLDDEGR